ncbi:HAD-IA family hydrolase [Lacisediminihabitans sp. G11-30]|uniref:HAD-IA family hydrolase n=2 Tax=Lacisediminihabitans changchengi TaxID=2787634 RepID=A0A934SIS5_9MICO|nr:HAD-IA family hydrolase [Lacisediminihabitans changchengi]
MDGTLVDSTGVVEQVWGEFAARYGVDVEQLFAFSHGRQAIDTVRRFLPDLDDSAHWGISDGLQADELLRLDGIVEIGGAEVFFRGIPASRVALVTSAPRELASRRMAAAGMEFPRVTITSEDVALGKPHPEGYLSAASRLGVDPSDVVVFEDAPAGIAAARASGATVVVVGPGTGGDFRVDDYRALTVTADDSGLTISGLTPA